MLLQRIYVSQKYPPYTR